MPKDFDQVTAFAAENIKIAGMRIALQPLLDLRRQAVHAAPHVGVADRQPHPHPRGNRDHRPDNALTTAAANPVGIDAGMRKRAFPANSISIAGVAGHPAPSPTGAIGTLGEAMADPDLPPPPIDLAGANLRPPGDLSDHRSRRQALGDNRPLLLSAPPTSPFRAGDDFKPRHRTVTNTSANTVACTSAYQPDIPPTCKAAITGRLRRISSSRRVNMSFVTELSSSEPGPVGTCAG